MARIHLGVLGLLAVGAVSGFLLAPSSGRFERDALMILCAVLAIIWHLAVTGPLLGTPATDGVGPVRAGPADGDDTAADGPVPDAVEGAATATAPTQPSEPEPAGIVHHPGYFDLPSADPVSVEVEIMRPPGVEDESVDEPFVLSVVDPGSDGGMVADADLRDVAVQPSVAQLWPPEGVEIPLVFIETDEPDMPPRVASAEPIIDLRAEVLVEAPVERQRHAPEPAVNEVVDLARNGQVEDPWLAFAAAMFRDPPA